MSFQPFFRGRRRIGGKLTSSAFHRGLDLPSIVIQSRSSVHLAQKKKSGTAGYCGTAYTVPGQGNQFITNLIGLKYPTFLFYVGTEDIFLFGALPVFSYGKTPYGSKLARL